MRSTFSPEHLRGPGVSGGTIKKFMLRAAFKAATDGGAITHRIIDETAREVQPLLEAWQAGFAHVG